ncbi:Short-chain dehydrogenase TIC 32 [Vigna angularis]|uniref:Short-chain dehydrogenase TIC 32 n=1 Tax=Phaseolus angularis TaxID=3914 RepID=A0A8T0JW05_PHAAN|nr:Short-chain dehydrogenase TIC 32 [Vigna angularis]
MRGVHVIMGVRNLITAKDVKEAILKEIPTAKLDYMELDLSSMASVRKFASNFISSGLPLNILINNAGIFAVPFTLSEDNIELIFATNHIGHFLLANLLLDTMKKTAHESKKQGRVVNVSSIVHQLPRGIRFDQINDPSRTSCQSHRKLTVKKSQLHRREENAAAIAPLNGDNCIAKRNEFPPATPFPSSPHPSMTLGFSEK